VCEQLAPFSDRVMSALAYQRRDDECVHGAHSKDVDIQVQRETREQHLFVYHRLGVHLLTSKTKQGSGFLNIFYYLLFEAM
jgi:hypothetical protein